MSMTNNVKLAGYCARKPILKKQNGTAKMTFILYTKDYVGQGKTISQAHRCIAYGKLAENIAQTLDTEKHLWINGWLRGHREGEGSHARYYNWVQIDDFYYSPPQTLKALESTLSEIIKEQGWQSIEEIPAFQK